METYNTKGTCSRQILFKFIGGCSGNLQGIAKLVKDRPLDEVIETLKGIKCRANTSCPDQLACALTEYKAKHPELQ